MAQRETGSNESNLSLDGNGDRIPIGDPLNRVARWVCTLLPYGSSVVATALSSLIAWALAPWIALDSLVMVYLVGVVVIAARYGRGPSIVAALTSSIAFDFFFTRPFFSLRIADPRLVMTVGIMLLVGLVISALTTALRERSRTAIEHARRIAALYALTRDLAHATDDAEIDQAARRHVARLVAAEVSIVRLSAGAAPGSIAAWVVEHGRRAGMGTTQFPNADVTCLPLAAAGRLLGIMIVRPTSAGSLLNARQARFLGNCAKQVASAMDRERLVRAAHASKRAAEEEQLRNSLLASVSHDLRQPLLVIECAAASLLEVSGMPANPLFTERIQLLVAEAHQMSDTVNKILDMTRLESTPVQLDRQWCPIETLLLGALERVRSCLKEHVVVTEIPATLVWIHVDTLVFEKLLTNLLENAAKFSPPGSTVAIAAAQVGNTLEIRVSDEGCGLPSGDTDAVFRKFQRGNQRSAVPGIGLGLAICRAIVELHGGHITARRRATAGTEFAIQLPITAGGPEAAQPALRVADHADNPDL
jgi:two-component system sensor histidine kinase KdpD